MRMGYDDFCRLRVREFEEACKAFHEQREQEIQLSYEVARYNASVCIAPHVKRKPSLPLPWDKPKDNRPKATAISKEDSLKRLNALLKKEKG